MKISNSTFDNVDAILEIYAAATLHQTNINAVIVWPKFERSLVENEISENRQFKITINNEIACVWVITFEDPEIWQEKNEDKAIYIHRIATNPKFRGNNFVKIITEWAIGLAKEKQLDYIRLDTVGENEKLIEVYTQNGFNFLGMFSLKNSTNLPDHYNRGIKAALFEIKL